MKHLIREIIPVILGILIALALNNWNENRKDKKYLNQIYTSIDNEFEESIINLKASIPKQQVLLDSITKYINDESISIYGIITKADGIQKPTINTNTWRAIANSKIELIQFEKLSALSEIEESKKSLELKTTKLVDFLIENLKTTNQEKKEVFLLLSQEILTTTKYSQLEIEEFLKK
ncbi:hypothetical protein GCM10011344_00590 [Dokdonia pacifica]|uniref:Uncharacterized protein n=1 Tax=Dokdonia pacifica TaxID=1627892 RepID=A0A239D0P7_9FLAO|nr:DUF6090 family protein [Dokdonia pacifica]GGG04081.1 hypothetical protein GCM10011344_00590 [Dokdonia pacifica]SNS25877.1 hypothetical protein SAMN06265376_10981 [Dokdonia pacifica]